MGRIPSELREIIAKNIRDCRMRKYPGRGGGKKCAETFGVSPQQWSPWERGMRTPDELRLEQIADFFGVTVEWLRRDHSAKPQGQEQTPEHTGEPPGEQQGPEPSSIRSPSNSAVNVSPQPSKNLPPGIPFTCPPCCPLLSQWSNVDMRRLSWLLEKFMASQCRSPQSPSTESKLFSDNAADPNQE